MMIILLTSSFKKNKNISYPLNHHLENQHHDFSYFKKPSSINNYYSRIKTLRPFRTSHDISTPAFKTDVDHFPQKNRIEKPINKYSNGIDSLT